MNSIIFFIICGIVIVGAFSCAFALHENNKKYALMTCVQLKKLIDSGEYDGWHGINPDLTETYGGKCIK